MDKIIKKWLDIFQASSLENLDCKQLALLYDDTHEQSVSGCATTIYEESNDDERKEFADVLLESIKTGTHINFVMVDGEGVMNEQNKDYFDWCERHTCWYQ